MKSKIDYLYPRLDIEALRRSSALRGPLNRKKPSLVSSGEVWLYVAVGILVAFLCLLLTTT